MNPTTQEVEFAVALRQYDPIVDELTGDPEWNLDEPHVVDFYTSNEPYLAPAARQAAVEAWARARLWRAVATNPNCLYDCWLTRYEHDPLDRDWRPTAHALYHHDEHLLDHQAPLIQWFNV